MMLTVLQNAYVRKDSEHKKFCDTHQNILSVLINEKKFFPRNEKRTFNIKVNKKLIKTFFYSVKPSLCYLFISGFIEFVIINNKIKISGIIDINNLDCASCILTCIHKCASIEIIT